MRHEVTAARERIQKRDIAQSVMVVDQLARVYSPPDRYEHAPTIIELSEPWYVPQHIFSWVHSEMLALGVYSFKEEVTPEEEEQYNRFLQKQLRPDPISSPHLPKTCVNWNRLNLGQFKNLSSPSELPVSGCSPDPDFYMEKVSRRKEWRDNKFNEKKRENDQTIFRFF